MRPDIQKALTKGVHCVGVGGMGMGPLAIYLRGRGLSVSGWDDAMTEEMEHHLRRAGVLLSEAGDELPEQCGCVVYSSAVKADHPVLSRARERGLLLLRRGELLAWLAGARRLIAVCGSHGKTTTTAMLIHALDENEVRFEYVGGALFADADKAPARALPNADGQTWLVAEVDESDGTINEYSPEISLIVNLEWDHPDHYESEKTLAETFLSLCRRSKRAVLVDEEYSLLSRSDILNVVSPEVQVLGFGETGDFMGAVKKEDGTLMEISLGGLFGERTAMLAGFGAFNARNAVAALSTLCIVTDGNPANVGSALEQFPGVMRRQGILVRGEMLVLEDYAHHPSEIHALLKSLRVANPEKRLVVVFQPHRYSRTKQFLREFAEVLRQADVLCLLDVYSAGENLVPGGESGDLYAELRKHPGQALLRVPGDDAAALRWLERECHTGDVLAFVGAGSIGKMAWDWCGHLGEERRYWDALGEKLGVQREFSLAGRSTMRVGGSARLYAEPANRDELLSLLNRVDDPSLKVLILGRGSNLIIPDEGVDALVLSLRGGEWENIELMGDGRIRAGAGVRMKTLCGFAAREGIEGLECFEGIPANLGGTLRMNAGAMGGSIYDVVETLEFVNAEGEITTLPRESLHVRYRCCEELARGGIALAAILKGRSGVDPDVIKTRMDAYREKRMHSQPREASAGSVFKNPEGNAAGRLIEECGLKGLRVGGAEISTLHGNFIVNTGANTLSADIIELVRKVRAEVEKQKRITLHPEVILFGKKWEQAGD